MEPDHRYHRILKVLKMAIAGRDLSYAQVEAAIGRGHNYLSRIFTGRSELKVMDLLRAVDALGLPADQILGPLILGPSPAPPAPASGAEAEATGEPEDAAADSADEPASEPEPPTSRDP